MAQLSAVEHLLAEGWAPRRTVLLAFGHDEEVGGERGAQQLAAVLARSGVRPALVLDEGMALAEGIVAGVTRPVALVGVAEKGSVTVELTVADAGGHSAMARRPTVIGRLARAVARLEEHPMPARIDGSVRAMARSLAPEMNVGRRVLLANLWLFGPMVQGVLDRQPEMDAMLRTTAAPTIFQAGSKENVLAGRARAVVNFRILPGDSVAEVVEHVQSVIADPLVAVKVADGAREPSPVSRSYGWGFDRVAGAVHGVWPQALVAPSLVLGGTDARHFAGLSPSVLRFAPLRFRSEDLERAHGRNERLAVTDLADAVRFYRLLLRDAAG